MVSMMSHMFCSWCKLFFVKVPFTTFCGKRKIVRSNNSFIFSFWVINNGSTLYMYFYVKENITFIKSLIFSFLYFFHSLFKYNFWTFWCVQIQRFICGKGEGTDILYPERFFQFGTQIPKTKLQHDLNTDLTQNSEDGRLKEALAALHWLMTRVSYYIYTLYNIYYYTIYRCICINIYNVYLYIHIYIYIYYI